VAAPWVFDFHSDVLSRLLEEPIGGFVAGRGSGHHRHYDLPRLESGNVRALVGALFTADARGEDPVVRTLRQIDNAYAVECATEGHVRLARTAGEIEAHAAAGRTALVLSIENGIAIADRLELLRVYHRLGVRAMGLVWNGRNAIADGCGEEGTGSKLTSFGRRVVEEMGRLGMLVDVSHISEAGFWDVLALARGPVIASHSNARRLCDHRRNLRDEQIAAIARSGGVVGVNACPSFVRSDRPSTIDDLCEHVLAIAAAAGSFDHVGIGADFDGIEFGPQGFEDPAAYPRLAERLAARGVGDADLEKLFHRNFLRVFRAVCG
jgi:membrane dipeptidase